MKSNCLIPIVLELAAVFAANAQDVNGPKNRATQASAPALPLVAGEVQRVDLRSGLVVLRHEEIPSIAMEAMTMEFDVADRKLLKGLKVGDKVKFQAAMINGMATVTELKPVK